MDKTPKKALVLLNMGGARNKNELKMFLTNMFNDKNILTVKSNLLRSFIAKFIVTTRLNSAWENYEEIGGFSPLNPLTEKLVEKLNKELQKVQTFQVMRYTPPFSNECIKQLKEQDIKDVILLPLYPQYSTTTTKSSLEDFEEAAKNEFNLTVIEPFYENEIYNAAIINSITKEVSNARTEDFNLIFSAHGLPQKIVDAGDPYEKQVNDHVEILTNLLEKKGITFKSISLAYQSKVGPLKWLEPALDDELKKYKDDNVLIYPIAFIVDNSETDFELSIEYKEEADKIGIKDYRVCKCVNDDDIFIEAIKNITKLN